MKKRSNKIIAYSLLIIPLLVAVVPHPAFAFLGISLSDIVGATVWKLTAFFSGLEIAFAGALVAITGSLLNASLTATLNMSAIVDNTTAVGIAWGTIRDFASIFIIFMLLQASIKIILGLGSDAGKLIKNIVIAGLLINFSLFFTKLAVDASNIVSLSFYTAIAPSGLYQPQAQSVDSSNSTAGSLVGLVSNAFNDGGLSNVFMQSLDLQAVASASSSAATLSGTTNTNWNITLANTGAAILMFFAAASFLAAAFAFAVRIGVLILLMAFSPVYFIAMIFPDLQKYSKKWSGMLYSMCIFMPAYLFLMYVAMSILNDPHFFDFAKVAASTTNLTGNGGITGTVTGALIGPNLIGIVLQYVIAILLINAPLVAAISIAGEGADFVGDLLKKTSKWGQGAITGTQKWAFRNTGGRAAMAISKNEKFKDFASKNYVGQLALKATRGVAEDYATKTKKRSEEKEKFADSLGFNEKEMAKLQKDIRTQNVAMAKALAASKGNKDDKDYKAAKAARDQASNDALEVEVKRKEAYSANTSKDNESFGGAGGLYNHVSRSNKTASAKLAITVLEKRMKRAKSDLDEDKQDLNKLEKDIKNTNDGAGNPAQNKKREDLLNDIAKGTDEVTGFENQIEELKLVK